MRKLLISLITLITAFIILTTNSFAKTYDELIEEIISLVDENSLPEYHKNLAPNVGYQMLYNKMYKEGSSSSKELFKSYTETKLKNIIQNYQNDWDEVWFNIISNLDVEPQYLDPNRILGIYYDANALNNSSYLYLIWTSKYIPSEFMTIESFELNGKTYNHYENDKAFYYDSKYYHYPNYDLSLHLTPIAGQEDTLAFGVPLTQKYKFSNIQIGIDQNQVSTSNTYSATIDSYTTFDLGIIPTHKQKSACQLVTHAYKLIKDCEAQSYYDLGFGGYIHLVHFNTTIPIDKIYRVDVNYTLTSDNKDWYQFWLKEDEQEITKSLRPEKRQTGIFNLYNTYGFKEGSFKSNEKESIEYKYEMMLNYSEQNWDIFTSTIESNYKRIKDFKILRLNYLVEDEIYNVEVLMDNVDGKTLSLIDRSLILDTTSATYKIKNKIYSIKDGIDLTKNIILSIIGIIVFLLIFYYSYKLIKALTKK